MTWRFAAAVVVALLTTGALPTAAAVDVDVAWCEPPRGSHGGPCDESRRCEARVFVGDRQIAGAGTDLVAC